MADPTPRPAPAPGPEGRRARPDRGHVGPVVVAGLVTAGLAALVSTRPWFTGTQELLDASQPGVVAGGAEPTYPASTGVALVLLAAWGVLLVTRRRVRRAFAVVAVVAAVGLVATVVNAGLAPPEPTQVLPGELEPRDPSLTGWYWLGALLAVVSVVPAVLAARLCPRWPEMGSRYDAPADAAAEVDARARRRSVPDTERELWRSLDEGHDPTEPPDARDAP